MRWNIKNSIWLLTTHYASADNLFYDKFKSSVIYVLLYGMYVWDISRLWN